MHDRSTSTLCMYAQEAKHICSDRSSLDSSSHFILSPVLLKLKKNEKLEGNAYDSTSPQATFDDELLASVFEKINSAFPRS